MSEMPEDWLDESLDSGLGPTQLYPNCKSSLMFSVILSLIYSLPVYNAVTIPGRDAFGAAQDGTQ